MIECMFTIDYEIYGNGEGTLGNLVLEPTKQLIKIFDQVGAKLVFFVEAAELEKIEETQSDPAIYDVKIQLKDLYKEGHEIALHLHPQWYRGYYKDGKWELDYSEYNLCVLPEKRIVEIVDRSINYLRSVLNDAGYTPLSFRAGNWLLQPTEKVAKVLSERGVKIDSSVFKGGLQYYHKLDYRKAIGNGYFWKFNTNVNTPDPQGILLEAPIHTKIVPFWKLITSKRVDLQRKSAAGNQTIKQKIYRIFDRMRLRQPLKLDFCRMTVTELVAMMEEIIEEDQNSPNTLKPVVLIGHTKDLEDLETVEIFLKYLEEQKIKLTTFQAVYQHMLQYSI